ncbi:sugar ABC transporter ATP-binding protein [Nitrospira sp.]|nr:sugar ABC transporter ATP-binding protein [Nitrospira sp.]
MSSNYAIRATDISKCYHIYDKPQDRLKQGLWRGRKQFYREFWALRDVSFDVQRGETVGVIGRNGSGKSTLLQLICGTLTPSYGSVDVQGRVAALLELGAGFNPEFTGRENVYLNGAVLGLSRRDVDARLNNILSFADIGQFIDQPVKTYSSGMYMRLAFAVQVHALPDILVVDEALSVGDFVFTLKCLKRIEQLRAEGASILFVSHDIGLVQKLCDRVLYLDKGQVALFGEPSRVCSHYISSAQSDLKQPPGEAAGLFHGVGIATDEQGQGSPTAAEEAAFLAAFTGHRTGSGHAEITFVTLSTTQGGNTVFFGESVRVKMFVRIKRMVEYLCLSMYVIDESGQLLLGTSTHAEHVDFQKLSQGDTVQATFEFQNRLRDGKYGITSIASSYVSPTNTDYLDYIEPALLFQSASTAGTSRWAMYNPPFKVDCVVNGSVISS